MVLAVGAGSLFFSHVNDAGFWLVNQYFRLTVGQTIKTWSIMETVLSVTGLAWSCSWTWSSDPRQSKAPSDLEASVSVGAQPLTTWVPPASSSCLPCLVGLPLMVTAMTM